MLRCHFSETLISDSLLGCKTEPFRSNDRTQVKSRVQAHVVLPTMEFLGRKARRMPEWAKYPKVLCWALNTLANFGERRKKVFLTLVLVLPGWSRIPSSFYETDRPIRDSWSSAAAASTTSSENLTRWFKKWCLHERSFRTNLCYRRQWQF